MEISAVYDWLRPEGLASRRHWDAIEEIEVSN